jgi:hypothetical protein
MMKTILMIAMIAGASPAQTPPKPGPAWGVPAPLVGNMGWARETNWTVGGSADVWAVTDVTTNSQGLPSIDLNPWSTIGSYSWAAITVTNHYDPSGMPVPHILTYWARGGVYLPNQILIQVNGQSFGIGQLSSPRQFIEQSFFIPASKAQTYTLLWESISGVNIGRAPDCWIDAVSWAPQYPPIAPKPQDFTLAPSGPNVVAQWKIASYPTHKLQVSASPVGPFANQGGAVTTNGGLAQVTIAIAGGQDYFRLKK